MNVVELNPEMMRSIEWHRRMEIASGWLWKMQKAGHLPNEVAEAFNNLFHENGHDISELVGCESLMDPGAIPLEDFDPDWDGPPTATAALKRGRGK
jgi:hypothetical protein